ncbi:TlpA family protein disulfide reductase [Epilithonimonas vandammei]|uniref:Thioredoxin domain-containing protein n=1 Tax=Epilithonimonas vandammei TaxID=2487072 RepID=A0A3G8Y1T0_9FLAO|nr:TlpA family protein disulfide reductase [Epilithonimonas vandammei]AZI39218.1 hypothetical protein EIB74_04255 [Epilithonimonas vandammei]
MKKRIIIIASVVVFIIFAIYNLGFQIGDMKIGKQNDEIQTDQRYDLENSEFTKNYLRSDGVSVINLWASWCKPCVEEMPIFENLKKEFPDCKFAMLSIDKDENDLREGIRKHKITNDITFQNRNYRKAIRNFLENKDSKSLTYTEIVPITYFIKNGKVIKKIEGSIDYNEVATIIKSLK